MVKVTMEAMMDLAGKKVTVMGLGRFGGGVGVTRWLAAQGADVLVTDMEPAEKLAESIAAVQPLIDKGSVRVRFGEHNASDFTTCNMVVANVAVPKPWENRYIRAAEAASIPVTTEIALFVAALPEHMRERTIGITGSVGKSTTTAMIHHALKIGIEANGKGDARVLMGGNIGRSLLDELDRMDERTWLVLELSSAMLYWIDRVLGYEGRAWSPRVAVATNLSANHIDWHGDLAHYTRSKQELIRHQRDGDGVVLGAGLWDWHELTPAKAVVIDATNFTREMKIPGTHNRENAAAAMAACRLARPEIAIDVLETAIAEFGGLPHRLQLVAEKKLGAGRSLRFYNDSKSTTPESCVKAVDALAEMPGAGGDRSMIHLIAGGYDKGSDLAPIAALAQDLGGLYTIGSTGAAIAGASVGYATECGTLDRAFETAMNRMRPGDALLLSPGCASWDQYMNYEHRGDAFIRLVEGRG